MPACSAFINHTISSAAQDTPDNSLAPAELVGLLVVVGKVVAAFVAVVVLPVAEALVALVVAQLLPLSSRFSTLVPVQHP